MNAVLLDIPLEPKDWPSWLERQLVGLELGELVDELQLVASPNTSSVRTLQQICGPQLPQVLVSGLGVLSEDQIRELLRYPQVLLELQENVLIDGGVYWQNLSTATQTQASAASTWQSLESRLAPSSQAVIPVAVLEKTAGTTWLRVLGLVAAAVIVAVGITIFRPAPAAPLWGFDRPGALAQNLPPGKYLNHLADAAQEWHRKRPESSEDLTRRLQEFRRGCDTLIAAPHPQLAAADRDWLRERCKIWAGKIDGHLADLSTGKKSVLEVRNDADETINKLVKALHDRAEKV